LQYRRIKGGKIVVESKDDMRARLKTRESPDYADALIYAYADDVLSPKRSRVRKVKVGYQR
jgi:hypothetical protein